MDAASRGPAVWAVTGGSGFLGRHLLARLDDRVDRRVVALGRRCPEGWPSDRFVGVDLERGSDLVAAIASVKPDVVIHAAGRTPPAEAEALYRGNLVPTLLLLDALRGLGRTTRVVLVGSAAEYGPLPVEDLPVNEDQACRPVGPYARGKWLASVAGLSEGPPLEVVVGRVFNPIGPGMPPSQAFGRFAALLADADCHELVVGDLDARRDFVDARDVAEALVSLAERGQAGRAYPIGTGLSRRVGDGLDHLLRRCGRPILVHSASVRQGPSDSRADTRRLEADTGWRPSIAFERSLDDLWDEVRASRGCR
jgi:GDP-4-dehydro-6-deoxy-D-mannose reductase